MFADGIRQWLRVKKWEFDKRKRDREDYERLREEQFIYEQQYRFLRTVTDHRKENADD
jgi:hypothetical protein